MHARRRRPSPDPRQPGPSPALPPAPMPRRHPCLAPLPAPLGLRFRALLGLGFAPPPEPRPCAHCASIAYALLPAARVPLCCHRADPESSSRSLPSGSPARIAPPSHPPRAAARRRPRPPLALRRPRGPGWQESHRMHPFFVECAKKAPFLAASARNACFSRSRWQHLRPMHPFPGAIGRFRIHGVRILPPRAHFRVEEPEITHDAKMLPAPRGLSAAAACGPAEWALRHAAAACDTRHGRTGFAPCGVGLACLLHAPPLSSRLCPPRPALPAISPAFIAAVLHASRFAARIAPTHAAIRRAAHCGRDELPIGLFLPPSCCPRRRIAPTDARSPAPPEPQPAPTESRPQANRVSSTRGAVCSRPRPATRRASPCRAGSAAVPIIPAKWCGDTIAHTRKLRF